ncbi:endonuclease-3 related protein [Ectothiorhodospira magna]|uniref:Endonuclease-3 related protein n=1 Tax=Ectothiorhodospira magna TaxID=867345 RepID=A0A1H9GKP4_9GAMM|nr:endonuclease-3 related protein [Ectothiorhodospira magna]
MNPERLHPVLERLSTHYGPMHWWPGETPFEVMVGAILTQNTAWTNVERAIANLKAAEVLDAESLAALPRNDRTRPVAPVFHSPH